MNEIVTGMFFWLLKILGAYLALMIIFTMILSRWKKKSKEETEAISQSRKKRSDR
ncbi:MAG: hypothetical protein K0U86_14675 [Planctomycetes bacterium]|nr:hypothetical protein [Planctomycetota bacterium]MCH9726141.1 hypothetical protein [Planctomycetota bacterium]MCH9775647.1 hypothetical protein [Planctomycetota bacterium]MCH9792575.1 hypothetical protein [Planctomycetota bacterium]MDF1744160.1 hypothetical protein [Gimesia sp.]